MKRETKELIREAAKEVAVTLLFGFAQVIFWAILFWGVFLLVTRMAGV